MNLAVHPTRNGDEAAAAWLPPHAGMTKREPETDIPY